MCSPDSSKKFLPLSFQTRQSLSKPFPNLNCNTSFCEYHFYKNYSEIVRIFLFCGLNTYWRGTFQGIFRGNKGFFDPNLSCAKACHKREYFMFWSRRAKQKTERWWHFLTILFFTYFIILIFISTPTHVHHGGNFQHPTHQRCIEQTFYLSTKDLGKQLACSWQQCY
jgi:hypothetical protein